MSAATSGRAREYRIRDHMVARGWLCIMRSAGSRGAADLAMLHPFLGLSWVQVGTEASKRLGPQDRDRLVAIAEQTHALPLLALAAPGVPPRFLLVTRGLPATWQPYEIGNPS